MRVERTRRRTRRFVRDFDRAVRCAQGFLESRYVPRKVITEARQEYARLLPLLPDRHGWQPFAQFMAAPGGFLAFHWALARNHQPVREARELAYALSPADPSHPGCQPASILSATHIANPVWRLDPP